MKVGIDAHYLGMRFGGNETFCENLINSIGWIDKGSSYEVYVNDVELALTRTNLPANVHLRKIWPKSIYLQRAFTMPLLAHQRKVRVLHVPFIAPPITTAKAIITIHDLAFEWYPKHFNAPDRLRMKMLVPMSARRADHIITVSEFSKRDIVARYGIQVEKVSVVPNGVDTKIFHPNLDQEYLNSIKRKYKLPDRYILYVGTVQPRKNLERLIKAFDQVVHDFNIPHHLIIAGRKGWLTEPIYLAAMTAVREDRIHFQVAPSYSDLPGLYSLAEIFAFPSLFEGFGLPPLEAMATGTPVITSNTSSLPEVVGKAALLVDPYRVEEIADAIKTMVCDENLGHELAQRGVERAQQFSWEKSARIAWEIYQAVGA
jgi:glycosyltransferase involved in cell wall biosynthesis